MPFQLDDFLDHCDRALSAVDAALPDRPAQCPRCLASRASLVADGPGVLCLVCGTLWMPESEAESLVHSTS